jgi:antagonist of KipI
MLRVVRSGLLTTVQDLGRWGHQSWGVPVAGPMDPWAHRLANHLVGNDERAALLEVTLTGPELVCDAPIVVAVTGAVFDVSIAGADGAAARMVPPAMAVDVPGSARLTFGARRAGRRGWAGSGGGR